MHSATAKFILFCFRTGIVPSHPTWWKATERQQRRRGCRRRCPTGTPLPLQTSPSPPRPVSPIQSAGSRTHPIFGKKNPHGWQEKGQGERDSDQRAARAVSNVTTKSNSQRKNTILDQNFWEEERNEDRSFHRIISKVHRRNDPFGLAMPFLEPSWGSPWYTCSFSVLASKYSKVTFYKVATPPSHTPWY